MNSLNFSKLIKRRFAPIAASMGLASIMAIGATAPAFADTASVAVTGGTLALTTSTNAATPVTITGVDQTTSYTVDMTATDPTGTGNGWNITMTSTTLTNGSRTLANGASTIAARPSVSCFAGSTCTTATDGSVVTYPYTVPAAATAPTATKVFSAAAASGLGKMSFSPVVSVALPANNLYAGTYTSTVTFAIVSAP